MRKVYILTLSLSLLLPLLFFIKKEQVNTPPALKKAKLMENYGKMPLHFIENRGQLDREVKFYERGLKHSTYFTEKGIYIALHGKDAEVLKIKPVGGNPEPQVIAEGKLSGKVNYLKGKDPAKWKRDIPTYEKVRYKEVYKGVDVVFYGNQRRLEYDVIVKPGADLKAVRFSYKGVKELRVNDRGQLVAVLPSGREVVQRRPIVYQRVDGERVELEGRYSVNSEGALYTYSFEVKGYDPEYALLIDPVLSYSTYFGGTSGELGRGLAVDSSGNAYITGNTVSADFPTQNAYDDTCDPNASCNDVFVTKLDSSGNLVYSTFLGGSNSDYGWSVAVDSSGNAYVTGGTYSSDFPVTNNSAWLGVEDAFVTKLSPAGNTILYSTYIGGGYLDTGYGIAVNDSGIAYITGETRSDDFPTTSDAYQKSMGFFPGMDAFMVKIDTTQANNGVIYATYLGGAESDRGWDIAVDSSGNAYITGYTNSMDFPTTANAFDSDCGVKDPCSNLAIYDAFVSKFNSVGGLVYSTYLGGDSAEEGRGIAVNNSGVAYVTGDTASSNFPTTPDAIKSSGASDAFFTKIDTTKAGGNSLLYSTYFGGDSGSDFGRDVAVDNAGNIYLTGYTGSSDFPVTQDAYQGTKDNFNDAFVTKLNPAGDTVLYSTFLGGGGIDYGQGIAVYGSGGIYVAGYTQSADFPTLNAFQNSLGGGQDAFVAKFSEPTRDLIVSKVGTGQGTVTSSPPGIDCGNDCEESFPSGTSVVLTATADGGSEFTGWGGDCSSCGTNTTCQIMLNADKTCSARFDSPSGSIPNAECGQITISIQGGLLKEAPFVSKNLPTFPITANAPCGAVNIKATLPGASLTVNVTFPNIPSNAHFYKLVNGTYHDVSSVVQINGNTVSLKVEDNGTYDGDTNPGEITDPLVMLVPESGSGGGNGGCSAGTSPLALLLPLAVVLVRVLRRKFEL